MTSSPAADRGALVLLEEIAFQNRELGLVEACAVLHGFDFVSLVTSMLNPSAKVPSFARLAFS